MRQNTAPVGRHGCALGEQRLVAADARGALEVVHSEVRHRIEGLNLAAPPRRLLLDSPPHLLQRAVPFWTTRASGAVTSEVSATGSDSRLGGTAVMTNTMLSNSQRATRTGLSRCYTRALWMRARWHALRNCNRQLLARQ